MPFFACRADIFDCCCHTTLISRFRHAMHIRYVIAAALRHADFSPLRRCLMPRRHACRRYAMMAASPHTPPCHAAAARRYALRRAADICHAHHDADAQNMMRVGTARSAPRTRYALMPRCRCRWYARCLLYASASHFGDIRHAYRFMLRHA